MGRDRDSLSVMTSLVWITGVYARNTGMYVRKKAVTATASDILLSIGRFRYGGQYTGNVNAFFDDGGNRVEIPYANSKKWKAVGFSPTENTKTNEELENSLKEIQERI